MAIPMFIQKLTQHLARKLWRDRAGYGRPITAAALDAEYRLGHWDHFFSLAELPRNLVMAGLIQHTFPKPHILDIGCGSGRLAQIYSHYPFESYLGVDVSTEGLSRARALDLPRATFIEGNYESWRPEGKSFDAIVFNECIGYANDPAATLRAFSEFLRPNGRFFLSHFRFGNALAQWRRLDSVCQVEFATAVTSSEGQVWDIRILQPRS